MLDSEVIGNGGRAVAVVVAHPDDEALWFGGSLMRMARCGTRLVIVSLTNARNTDRAGEFESYCASLGAVPAMLDYPDGGREVFPAFPTELTALLAAKGFAPPSLGCVITHSPLGNERAHPQHVQTWRAVTAWAAAERVPAAFFSEKAVDELGMKLAADLGNGIRVFKTTPASRRAMNESLRNLRATPADLRGHVRPWVRLLEERRMFAGIRSALQIRIDQPAKAALIEQAYSVRELRSYAAYHHDVEYLYTDRAATDLAAVASCHSS